MLTKRQRQVVELLQQGLTCPQVARRLGIRLLTVRAHVRDIAAKVPGQQPPIRRIVLNAVTLLEAA
jgi:DNA-binding NarL/FixJ family response regulator